MARKHNVNDIWVISDLHFSDPDMIRRDRKGRRLREFDTIDAMDEHIIERFNSRVKPGSKVYILGDMGHNLKKDSAGREKWLVKMRRLHGMKRLILGNHDDADVIFYREAIAIVTGYRRFDEDDLTMWFSHIPLHPRSLGYPKLNHATINVHGHMHAGGIVNDDRYINVCAERVDYLPLHYDELAAMARAIKDGAAA